MLSNKRSIILFSIPSFLFYTVFIIVSTFSTIKYSFTDFSGIGKANFVGMENYKRLLTDEIFIKSCSNTIIILIVSFLLILPISFFLAYVLDWNFKGSSAVKALNFTPYIIAPVIVAAIWVFLLDPTMGVINNALKIVGLEKLQQEWIGGNTKTPYSIGVVYAWQSIGYYATIFLAGLKTVPTEIYEASSIEGANAWQKLRYITLPMIKDSIVIVIVLAVNGALKIFELVYQMTNGGPNHKSETAVTYMYYIMFKSGKYSYGSAMAVVVLVACMIFTLIYIRNVKDNLE